MAEQTGGGLDILEESPSSVPVTETLNISGSKIPLKTALNSDILKNLQDELDRRTGKSVMGGIDQIIQGFRENAAFTSSDPASALMAIEQEKRAKAAEIMGMRNNIAAIKQAQALQSIGNESFGKVLSGAGAAGAGGGGEGEAGIDPAIMAEVRRLYNLPGGVGLADAKALYDKALMSAAAARQKAYLDPAGGKQETYFIDGVPENLTPNEYRNLMSKPPDVRKQILEDLRKGMAPVKGQPARGAGAAAVVPAEEAAPSLAVGTAPAAGAAKPAKQSPIPEKLLDNLKGVESSGNPLAVNKASGAMGAYQFMPNTVAGLHKMGIEFNPFDEKQSREAARKYLEILVDKNGGDLRKALAQYGGFVKKDPTNYVNKVMAGVDTEAPSEKPVAAAAAAPKASTQLTLEGGKVARTPAEYAAEIEKDKTIDAATKNSMKQRYTEGYNNLLKEQQGKAPPAAAQPSTATAAAPAAKATDKGTFAVATQENMGLRKPRNKAEYEANEAAVKLENERRKAIAQKEQETAIELGKREVEKAQDVTGKTRETSAGEAGKREAEMRKLTESAMEALPAAEKVLQIANDPKRSHVMGYVHGTNPAATALYTAGSLMPFVGDKQKIEEGIVTNKLNKQELADYRTIQNASAKLGIQFAAEVFKGARLGIGLEKMAQNAKGIGTELPAEVNRTNAQLIRDAMKFQLAKEDLYKNWKSENPSKTFADFEDSPQYNQLRTATEQHLINTYKGVVVPDKFSKYRKPQ